MVKSSRRRRKKVLTVLSPPLFGGVEVGNIIVGDIDHALGRRLETQLSSLTKIPTHMFIKCRFKIIEVRDGIAYTEFDGMEYFREYIRSLFMKGSSYVDIYRDIYIDGLGFRIFSGVFTQRRINTARKRAIRREVYNVFNKYIDGDWGSFIKDAVYGVIDTDIYKASKKIYPVRWAGIIKIKRLR